MHLITSFLLEERLTGGMFQLTENMDSPQDNSGCGDSGGLPALPACRQASLLLLDQPPNR